MMLNGTIDNSDKINSLQDEVELRRKIEEYYLPKQLINAIIEIGSIPETSIETEVGIGFIDIANYTYLSRFLSPKENQVLLNGLYSAFNFVIDKHCGFLNKIEGDSLMFQFGGFTDQATKGLNRDETTEYITRELFYTCIEIQNICMLFNQANEDILKDIHSPTIKQSIEEAFFIIKALRSDDNLAGAINALFQIKIRIGANIGLVSSGNFGPDGAKQWDIIGLPVIKAKRMESTAPIGGFRISEDMYILLDKYKITDSYLNYFRNEALKKRSPFSNIKKEDLFSFSRVILKDKNNSEFDTYSVQVNPSLPLDIVKESEIMIGQGEDGAERIIEFIKYYRGKEHVINAIEKFFYDKGVIIRKEQMVQILLPKQYESLSAKLGSTAKLVSHIRDNYTLFKILNLLSEYQDTINKQDSDIEQFFDFIDYYDYTKKYENFFAQYLKKSSRFLVEKYNFYNRTYPFIFILIKGSIMEYQRENE